MEKTAQEAQELVDMIDKFISEGMNYEDPWEWIYDRIFCKDFMSHVHPLRLEICYPDTSYEEDVSALREALVARATEDKEKKATAEPHIFNVNGQVLHVSIEGDCLQITSNYDIGIRDGSHIKKHHTQRIYLKDHYLM